MKNKVGCFVKVIFFFIFLEIAFFIINDLFLTEEDVPVADGFTIESYNVTLDVKENNKVYVNELIMVDWYEGGHHGIYRFIPEWLEYTGKDGKTIKRKSKIYDLSSTDPFTVDMVKKKQRIKIGSSNSYVPVGLKTYEIDYIYDMGSDPYQGFDEFIFHTFGDYWGTEIKNIAIQINMPKEIDQIKIHFYADKYREKDITEYINYYIFGNTIFVQFNSDGYKLTKSLTVDVELPENYFTKGSWNYGYKSLVISIIIVILTVLTILRWFKYGKNYSKYPQTVEFYPPDKLNSAEVGYIYGQEASMKLAISLIITLASKGYIKIDEINNKKDIIITNLYKKPKTVNFQVPSKNLARKIEVEKLKQIDDNLNKEEKLMMTYLFKEDNKKTITANFDKFDNVSQNLIKLGYIRIISDNKEDIELIKKEQHYDEQEKGYMEQMKKYNEDISHLQQLSKLEEIVYNQLFINDDVVILKEHKSFYTVFNDISYELDKKLKYAINDKKADSKLALSIFISILVFVLNVISYAIFEDLDPKLSLLYYISFACIIINIFFTMFMRRKTKYGEELTSRIKGFRNFLTTVEKEQLELLVNEHPTYFYDILPYTYVLGISKAWIKKFENIPMEKINVGNFDYYDVNSWDSIYDNISFPVSSSSSSGSYGGGCSSCGGGCSSCGGGGSW